MDQTRKKKNYLGVNRRPQLFQHITCPDFGHNPILNRLLNNNYRNNYIVV